MALTAKPNKSREKSQRQVEPREKSFGIKEGIHAHNLIARQFEND